MYAIPAQAEIHFLFFTFYFYLFTLLPSHHYSLFFAANRRLCTANDPIPYPFNTFEFRTFEFVPVLSFTF